MLSGQLQVRDRREDRRVELGLPALRRLLLQIALRRRVQQRRFRGLGRPVQIELPQGFKVLHGCAQSHHVDVDAGDFGSTAFKADFK